MPALGMSKVTQEGNFRRAKEKIAMNYYKQRSRAMNIARSYTQHVVAPPNGAARLVIKSPARTAPPNLPIYSVDTNAPKRNVLKNGTRRVTFK